jgi:succinate-acetate transporter protein
MSDLGQDVTTVCWGVAALAAATIAVPQAILLCRTLFRRDELWWFRLKTTLLFGSLALALGRNLAVWADYTWFGQRYLGTIDHRWAVDLILSSLIMLACLLAAGLYWKTRHEAPS